MAASPGPLHTSNRRSSAVPVFSVLGGNGISHPPKEPYNVVITGSTKGEAMSWKACLPSYKLLLSPPHRDAWMLGPNAGIVNNFLATFP